MRPRVAVFVLSGVLVCMFGVAWSQNSNTTRNANAVPNINQGRGNGKRLANGGVWDAEAERRKNIDGNTGRQIMNGSWNANDGHWDLEGNFARVNAAITPENRVFSNAVKPAPTRKKPARKKIRRPSAGMGGAISLGNILSAMLVAGV